jgi:hypothetical protein
LWGGDAIWSDVAFYLKLNPPVAQYIPYLFEEGLLLPLLEADKKGFIQPELKFLLLSQVWRKRGGFL